MAFTNLKPLFFNDFVQALKAAGLIASDVMVQRVIIDAEVDNFVRMHVQYVGDKKLLELTPLLARMEIEEKPWRE